MLLGPGSSAPARGRWCSWPLVLLTTAAIVARAGTATAAENGRSPWMFPVEGAVVRPFVEPAGPYGPGHRGVDLAAATGTAVHAANDGAVTFAGQVAGRLHVVVLHANGIRTSYSFLSSVSVVAGAQVHRGDVLGAAGGVDADSGHDGSVLHFGVRVGDRHVDPMLLLEPLDLAAVVRLVPVDPVPEGSWSPASERRALVQSLSLPEPGNLAVPAPDDDAHGCSGGIPVIGGAVDAVCTVTSAGAHEAGVALDAAGDQLHQLTGIDAHLSQQLRALAGHAVDLVRAVGPRIARSMLETPLGQLVQDFVEMGERFVATRNAECTHDAPPADGSGGSAHRVMVVAGINSSGAAGDKGPTNRLDVQALGYERTGEVRYFSYAADGGRYGAQQTYGDLMAVAQRLGEQLRDMQRDEPGREVDLIAHSQGGVVVDLFLTQIYEAAERSYPPLGTVVTLSSPHQGDPAAAAAVRVHSAPIGHVLTDDLDSLHLPLVPPVSSPAVRQLAEGSPLMDHLWERHLPEHVDFTTIGTSEDYVVPANRISVPGAQETVVGVESPSPHTAILTDPDALRAVRAALEGNAPPCVGLVTALRSSVAPVVITRATENLGIAASKVLTGARR